MLVAIALGAGVLLPIGLGCQSTKPAQERDVARSGERYFPTGDRATSSVVLRQFTPREIRVGQEYD